MAAYLVKEYDPDVSTEFEGWTTIFTDEIISYLIKIDILEDTKYSVFKEYLFLKHGVTFKNESKEVTAKKILREVFEEFTQNGRMGDEGYASEIADLSRKYAEFIPGLGAVGEKIDGLLKRGKEITMMSDEEKEAQRMKVLRQEERHEEEIDALLAKRESIGGEQYRAESIALSTRQDEENKALHGPWKYITGNDTGNEDMMEVEEWFGNVVYKE